ncbi:aminopeptidase P family protein [Mycoplasmatota bacterium zrk1]
MIVKRIKEIIKNENYQAIFLAGNENEAVLKNIRYVSGFTGTSGYVFIGADFGYFISDFRYRDQAKNQVTDLEFIEIDTTIFDVINDLIKKHNVKLTAFDKKLFYSEYEKFDEELDTKLVPLDNVIEKLRISKNEDEIKLLQEACNITDRAFSHILDFIKPGMTEKQVERELKDCMLNEGADGAWDSFIVASGPRGAMPHGKASNKVIETGELVTLDIGCVYKGYTSDMTRTIAVGEVSDKLKEIYEVVKTAQQKGLDAAKAGITGKELDAVCRDYISSKGYKEQFKHGTGHGIGLDVHEAPYVSVRNENPLEEGACVSIEPGIYITDLGGVRIEDDIILTRNGCIVLNNSPKDLIKI